MVKITGPLHSDHASKQLGKNTIYKTYGNRSFATNYNKPASVKPFTPSPDQYNQRMLYNLIIARWQTLTDNQKAVYNDETREKGLQMSGWNYFLREALKDLQTYIGLIGYWPLNQLINNQLKDLSGNNNHGTNHGAIPTTDQKGRKNGAMSFNGINNYIDLKTPTSLMSLTYPLTFECWAKAENWEQNGILISLDVNNINSDLAIGIYIIKDVIFLGISTYKYGLSGISTYLTADTWQHWTLVFTDTTHMSFYLDGVKKTLVGIAGYYSVSGNSIGARANGSQWPFNGSISDVRIYNRALSPTEITQLYKVTKP